jgi:hypothetical protein
VAHEIGNPVTGIACLAQNLRDAGGDPEVTQGAEEILKQTHRISRIVNSLVQLLTQRRPDAGGQLSPLQPGGLRRRGDHLLSLDRDAPGAQFSNRCDRELLVFADQQLLLQVFINLLDNARAAAGGTGAVEIDASGHDEVVHVHVDNTGPAIDPGVLSTRSLNRSLRPRMSAPARGSACLWCAHARGYGRQRRTPESLPVGASATAVRGRRCDCDAATTPTMTSGRDQQPPPPGEGVKLQRTLSGKHRQRMHKILIVEDETVIRAPCAACWSATATRRRGQLRGRGGRQLFAHGLRPGHQRPAPSRGPGHGPDRPAGACPC